MKSFVLCRRGSLTQTTEVPLVSQHSISKSRFVCWDASLNLRSPPPGERQSAYRNPALFRLLLMSSNAGKLVSGPLSGVGNPIRIRCAQWSQTPAAADIAAKIRDAAIDTSRR